MFTGIHTALITPLRAEGAIDCEGLERLVEFQIAGGVQGLVVAGTTGESPTLSWQEHCDLIARVCRQAAGRCRIIAGTGSNSTYEALTASEQAVQVGVDGLLLVDPYYNGPSSLEIRRAYLEPIARRFPELQVIPYLVPGRTGTALLPEDLALLAEVCPNVRTVKEATGDPANAARIRRLCGADFSILSGDDEATLALMRAPEIGASGAISVWSNLFPGPLNRLVSAALKGNWQEAERLHQALTPLLGLVHVATTEASPHGPVRCRARSPLPLKSLMSLMGLPAGPCRPPLGRMTQAGLEILIEAVDRVHAADPTLLGEIAAFFTVDIAGNLANGKLAETISYAAYTR